MYLYTFKGGWLCGNAEKYADISMYLNMCNGERYMEVSMYLPALLCKGTVHGSFHVPI